MNAVMPIFLTKSLRETQKTYEAIGFSVFREAEQYLIMRMDDVELHFGEWTGFQAEANICAAYIRTDDIAYWEKAFSKLGWEGKGIPRVSRTADQPWGMREFHIVDTMGNLIKVGSILKKP